MRRLLAPLAGTAVLALALVSLDCGGGSSAPRGVELRPGDSLLDHARAIRVVQTPQSIVPSDLAGPLGDILTRRVIAIDPTAWTPETHRLKSRPELAAWKTRPAVRLDLDLGPPQVEHEGRALIRTASSLAQVSVVEHLTAWQDDVRPALFRWNAHDGTLTAYAAQPPGPFLFHYRPGSDGVLDAVAARLAPGARVPTHGDELVRSITLERWTLPALLAPAPTTLALDVEPLLGDALSLALGVLDLGLALEDGRLIRSDSPGDGVTFAVDVESEGRRTRAFEQHVVPQEGFFEAQLDLAEFTGRTVTLLLSTSAGPAGDVHSDLAVWGDLRLTGDVLRPPARPHVVLVDVDTLRADRLGCYGYERETSPRIDAWARSEGVVYTHTSSASDWTLPSTASILTGLLVSQHTVHEKTSRIPPATEPIAVRLKRAGYETLARTDGGWLSPEYGFDQGFDSFDTRRRSHDEHQRVGWKPELERLRTRRSEKPVFFFLQTFQVHDPHEHDLRFDDPDAPYDGHFASQDIVRVRPQGPDGHGYQLNANDWRYVSDVYDAAVRRMDDVVGAFLEGLAGAFGDEPYLVFFTSDHGEEISERGDFGHGHSLYDEVVRVPLIVRFPGGKAGRVESPASNLDIVPTILDVVGLPSPEHLPGRSLRAGLAGPRPIVSEHGPTTSALLLDGWKLVHGKSDTYTAGELPALYHVAADPDERDDRSEHEVQRRNELLELLERFRLAHPRVAEKATLAGELSPEVLAELRAMGYLGEDE